MKKIIQVHFLLLSKCIEVQEGKVAKKNENNTFNKFKT